MIQRQMQLDGSFLPRPCGPRKHLRTQCHNAGIDAEQPVLESEFRFVSQFRTAPFRCLIKNVPEEFPRTVAIGISQGRTLRYLYAKLLQSPFTTAEPASDLPQRLCIGQLAKQHGHKMVPASKTSRMPLDLCRLHLLMKLIPRKHLEQLRHDAAKSLHG